jgi:hypothetical protein
MNSTFLLPNKVKRIGWILLIAGLICGILNMFFEYEPRFLDLKVLSIFDHQIFKESTWVKVITNNLFDEITTIILIISLICIAFSKEKIEDEFISKIRYESLVWAIYVNYAVLILATLFLYDTAYFWVLVFNIFTILVFFIIRFYWIVNKMNKAISYEK